MRALRGHGLTVALSIGVAALVAASDVLYAHGVQIIAVLESAITLHPVAGMLLFVLLAMVSAMLAFFSSAVVVPVGVSAWGPATCFGLLWAGWLLGGVASFAIGRYFGESLAPRLLGSERLARFRARLNRDTRFFHVLLLQAALPSEIPGYVLGIARYPFRFYLLALVLTELPYAFGTVYLGQSFLERRSVLLLVLGALALAVSALCYRLVGNGRANRGHAPG